MRCRFCGSTALHNDTQHKNFSGGKAVAGAVLVGAVGAAAGLIGKNVSGWRCGACGQFMAEPMDVFLEMQIDAAVHDAEAGKDPSMFRYYQGQFPNVQAHLPAAAPSVQHVPVERPVLPTAVKDEEAKETVKRCYEPGVWQQGCPIFVDAVTIRTKDENDLMSLSAVNLSEKTIRSAYFQAVIYDDTGDEVARRQCVYQNLNIPGGSATIEQKRLPEDKTFPLGTDLAHRVDLLCEKVAFADDEVWRMDENAAPVELPAQPVLSEQTFPRYRYIQSRLRSADREAPLRMPVEADGFWLCDCGHPAKNGEACPFCGDTLPVLQDAFSQKTLESLQLAAVKERAAKRAAFSQKLYQDTVEKENQKVYQEALSHERKGTSADLYKAISVWETILDYSDAKEHLEQCRKRAPELAAKEEAKHEAELKAAEEAKRAAAEEKRLEEEKTAAEKKKRNKIIAIASAAAALVLAAAFLIIKVVIPNVSYNKAVSQMEAGEYGKAILAFDRMDGFKDSAERLLAAKTDGTMYQAATQCFEQSEQDSASWKHCTELWQMLAPPQMISAGFYHSVGLKDDGSVVATGNNDEGQCDVSEWADVVSVAAGGGHTVGLLSDGTVVATGNNEFGQCDVSEWKDIVAIAAGGYHTVGLRADGTVVATGNNEYTQCDVQGWKDVSFITVGQAFTAGMNSKGEVVYAGPSDLSIRALKDKTFIAIAGGGLHLVALSADGVVTAVGNNDEGQCNVSSWKFENVVSIAAGAAHTLGLRADGTVVAVGWNDDDQREVSDWSNIVGISANIAHSIGLRADGTVIAVGFNDDARCDVEYWASIQTPDKH